jgi:hypothetical protein
MTIRRTNVDFTPDTQALIDAAAEKRDMAVEDRQKAKESADAATAAKTKADDDARSLSAGLAEAEAAKKAALQAIDKELSIPAYQAPAPVAAAAAAHRRR